MAAPTEVCKVERPYRLPRVPKWDWMCTKKTVQGEVKLCPQQGGDTGLTRSPWLQEKLASQPQQPELGLSGECHLLLLSNPCAKSPNGKCFYLGLPHLTIGQGKRVTLFYT